MATALGLPPLRRGHSLQTYLLATYLLIVVVGVGGLVAWAGFQQQRAILARARQELFLHGTLMAASLAEPLEHWYEGRSSPSLPLLLEAYSRDIGADLRVLDPSLRPVLQSGEGRGEVGEEEGEKEGHMVLPPSPGGAPAPDDGGRMVVKVPLFTEKGVPLGVLEISAPMGPVRARVHRSWLGLGAAGAVALLGTVLASLWLARRLTRPLYHLTRTAEAMAGGDLSQRAQVQGPTEVARLAQTLNRMAEQLQGLLARQQAFVAHSAHELRTPLASIRLRLDLLERYFQRQPELARHYLPQVSREVEHLQRLVEQLLALARLERGVALERRPRDLAPLLYSLAEEMAPLAREAGISLEVEVPPHLPPVPSDADALLTAFRNLLDNALHYTPPGGRVVLGARTEGRWVRVWVRDTGRGIPPEDLPRIFEPFYRGEEARARRHGGAGLGLALVKRVVEAHNGRVGVESTPGQGTTLTVYLPVAN